MLVPSSLVCLSQQLLLREAGTLIELRVIWD